MGVFSRLGDIVNANINALLDRAEDPEKIVRLIVQEMEDTLVEVRSAAARSIAEKKELSRRLERVRAAQADWQAKAELAIRHGRDDLAKAALSARTEAVQAATQLEAEIVSLDEALAKTGEDLERLQVKLDEAKVKQKAIVLRQRTAQDRVRLRTQLHDGRIDDALARYDQIQRKIDALEGQIEAFDVGRGGRSLAQEFAELETQSAVERELAELKARLGRSDTHS
jgi:phage shock protein A